ncbi:hypothetical protein Tco_0267943 [Tanacetum coccineum]
MLNPLSCVKDGSRRELKEEFNEKKPRKSPSFALGISINLVTLLNMILAESIMLVMSFAFMIMDFLPKEATDNEGVSSPSISINTETPVTNVEPLNSIGHSQFVKNTADLKDSPLDKDDILLIDSSVANRLKNQKFGVPPKVAGKRKQVVPGTSSRKTHQNTPKAQNRGSEAAREPPDPLDVDSDPDLHELKDSTDCYWVVVYDNAMNQRTNELMSSFLEARTAYDTIRERDKKKDNIAEAATLQEQVEKLHGEYSRLVVKQKKWVNYEQTLASLCSKVECLEAQRKRLEESEVQLLQQINGLKQDRATIVAKVVLHIAMKLSPSEKMGFYVAQLVKAAIIHGRCTTFKEVSVLKDPFELKKMPYYRPFSKKIL